MINDLNSLLNERPGSDDTDGGALGAPHVPVVESPTAVDCNKWDLHCGEAIAQDWAENDICNHDPLVVADAHAALFKPEPRLAEHTANVDRSAWFKQLMETPEFQAIHNQTSLNLDLAPIAAKGICDEWQAFDEANAEAIEQRGDGDPLPGSDDEALADTIARMRSTQQALAQAQADVDTASDVAAGLGMGEPGSIDRQSLAKYFKQVQNNPQLREIFAMAGRFKRRARSLQKQKVNATRGEITGVELDGDVARLLPMELAMVAGVIPELQDYTLYRLATRRCMCYKHKTVEPKQSGPFVGCIDESGSMSGAPIVAAKGLAMTMAWLASYQNRWIALVGFSDGNEGNAVAFPPHHKQQEQLIEWLLHFYGGGTTLDVPLDVLPRVYWQQFIAAGMPRGKTDVVIITDAQVSCPDAMRDAYKKWAAAEQVKTYGIIIGAQPGSLSEVCDRCFTLPELNIDTDAVESVLSI